MIITDIKLENFGGHALLDCKDINAQVVGIVGPNGQGKSTLLAGIKWGVSGKLKNTADTYMRHGGVHGPANLELAFQKNGEGGEIKRRINKSGQTRALKWGPDEKPKTSSAEVDAIMGDILGADKRSVIECVFVPQGGLQELLFEDPATREKQFQRMIGCAHFETVANNAKTIAAQLKQDYSDVTAQIEAAHLEVQELAGRRDALERTVGPDQTARLAEGAALRVDLLRLSKAQGVAEMRSQEFQALLRSHAALGGTPQAVLDAMWSKQNELNLEVTAATQRLTAKQQEQQSFQELRQLVQQYQTAQASSSAAEQRMVGLTDQSAALQKARTDWSTARDALTTAQTVMTVRQRHAEVLASLTRAKEELQNMPPPVSEDTLLQLASEVAKAEADESLQILQVRIPVLKSLAQTGAETAGHCPVCEGQFQMNREVLADLIRVSEQTLSQKQAAITLLRRTLNAEQTKRTAHLQDVAVRESTVRTLQNEVDVMAVQVAAHQSVVVDVVNLQRTIDALLVEGQRLAGAQEAFNTANGACEQARAVLVSWSTSLRFQEVDAWTKHLSLEPNAMVAASQLKSDEIEQIKRELEGLKLSQSTHSGTYLELQKAWKDDEAARAELTAALANQPKTTIDISNLDQQMAELQTLQSARLEALARLDEVLGNIRSRQATLERLAAVQAKNQKIEQGIKDMEELGAAFSREGIARKYLDDVFGDVLEACTDQLLTFGTDFRIRKAEGILAFEFRRHGDPEGFWMPQSLMSGGQKVRMAIAFLMALQQVVLPDVGLLVLDEPTTHLDAEGREGLRDLLMALPAILKNREAQVWVCDHSPDIRPAFQRCIDLTPKEVAA